MPLTEAFFALQARYGDLQFFQLILNKCLHSKKKADIVSDERRPMKLAHGVKTEHYQMIGSKQCKEYRETDYDRNGTCGILDFQRSERDNGTPDIPKGDLALPTGIPAPQRHIPCHNFLENCLNDKR